MMDKFAADDRIEQMNTQRRRLKQQEHRRAVEALIDERRARREFERQQVKETGTLICTFLFATSSGETYIFFST